MQASQVYNSINVGIRNANYCFRNEHKHIYGEFQIHYCTFKGDIKG